MPFLASNLMLEAAERQKLSLHTQNATERVSREKFSLIQIFSMACIVRADSEETDLRVAPSIISTEASWSQKARPCRQWVCARGRAVAVCFLAPGRNIIIVVRLLSKHSIMCCVSSWTRLTAPSQMDLLNHSTLFLILHFSLAGIFYSPGVFHNFPINGAFSQTPSLFPYIKLIMKRAAALKVCPPSVLG